MSYKIVPTPPFDRELKQLSKKYPTIKKDFAELITQLLDNPHMGTAIGSDCYKIRMAISSKGKGKSGGARIITCVRVANERIFLVSIYDKSESENISEKTLRNRLDKLA